MNNSSEREQEIRDVIEQWRSALEARDLDRMMTDYIPDVILYDAIPPYKSVGVTAIRQAWESCMPHLPDFKSVHRDLTVTVTEDMAVVHGLHNFETAEPHPCSQSWIRITVCYRRIDGRWRVFHEHVSLPFNPLDNQAWPITDPDSLTMPNYGN